MRNRTLAEDPVETSKKKASANERNASSQTRFGVVSLLPGSIGDARRIRETGELNPIVPPPTLPNPTGYNLQDQLGRFVLSERILIPEFDPRGNPSATKYESWRKANHSKIGTPSNTYSIKGRGMVACHSNLERMFLSYCEMNPLVVEIRSQYPEWDRKKSAIALAANKSLLKTDIMSIDFVLTLQVPRSNRVHYHAVSCKPFSKLMNPDVIRRHEREISTVGHWRCTHQIFTDRCITRIQDRNNQRLLQFMMHTENVSDHAHEAYQFSQVILKAKGDGDLDGLITWAAEKIGRNRDYGYKLFGIAHFLGYMVCDHSVDLLPETRVNLTKNDRHFLPRFNPIQLPGAQNQA